LVIVKLCDFVSPSTTLPKLKIEGETASPVWTASPVKLTVSGDPGASLVTLRVPVAFPEAIGANFTLSVAVCDGARVVGTLIPLTLKPLPAAVMLPTCTAAWPEFVSVRFCEALLPTATLEKAKLAGFAVN
jgi:hypothetical protein